MGSFASNAQNNLPFNFQMNRKCSFGRCSVRAYKLPSLQFATEHCSSAMPFLFTHVIRGDIANSICKQIFGSMHCLMNFIVAKRTFNQGFRRIFCFIQNVSLFFVCFSDGFELHLVLV